MEHEPDATDAELLAAHDRTGTAFAELYRRHVDDVLRYFVRREPADRPGAKLESRWFSRDTALIRGQSAVSRRTGCAQTAADLTSETFAAALSSRRRFRDTGAPGRAWLFKIAERQLHHFIRREVVSQRARQRLRMQPIVLDDDELERVEQLADYPALAASVREALAELPAGQAEALSLRIADRLPYRDVAVRLGCTEGAARVRVSRGLTTLANRLGELR